MKLRMYIYLSCLLLIITVRGAIANEVVASEEQPSAKPISWDKVFFEAIKAWNSEQLINGASGFTV